MHMTSCRVLAAFLTVRIAFSNQCLYLTRYTVVEFRSRKEANRRTCWGCAESQTVHLAVIAVEHFRTVGGAYMAVIQDLRESEASCIPGIVVIAIIS